jgi:hypothetical protein
MNIAYLIITHRNPLLLQRLIDHLSGEDASFFVHVDAKADFTGFARVKGQNVHFIENRIPVYWGEFSQVTASLILIEAALRSAPRPDYLMLFTGSEFPLRSKEYIHRYLEERRGRQFITMAKTPSPGKPLERVTTIRFPRKRPVLRFFFRALAKVGLATRDYKKHFGKLEPYSGVGWWALTTDACEYILEFARQDETIAQFFHYTHASDEAYIQTILGNSPYRAQAQRCFLLEDWSGCVHHPRMIDDEHLRKFESEPKVMVSDCDGTTEVLFARKYSDERIEMVDKTVAMIRRKEGVNDRRPAVTADLA